MGEGKYIPKPNDYETEHDFYWYILNDTSGKLPGMGGVFNAINMDVYHYGGNNPVKYVDPDGKQSLPYNIGNPYAFIMQLLKDKYENTFNEAKNQTTSSSIRFATGFIKGFFGPDFTKLVEKCGKDMSGFYVDEFMSTIDVGEIAGQVAGLLTITVGAYQSGKEGFKLGYNFGKNVFKEIMNDPKMQKDFLTGFEKGLIPSIKPSKFNSLAEGIGYILGNVYYTYKINDFNNKINND